MTAGVDVPRIEFVPEITSPGADVRAPAASRCHPFPSDLTCAWAGSAAHANQQVKVNDTQMLRVSVSIIHLVIGRSRLADKLFGGYAGSIRYHG